MSTALLILLAIVIAWFVFKAMSKNAPTDASGPAELENRTTGGTGQGTEADAGSASSQVTETAAGAGAAGGTPAHTATSEDSSLFPSTGNVASDIAEMFKVLNLRASDAPRLSLSSEQYESLKGGDAGGLSGDVLAGVMQKLKAML